MIYFIGYYLIGVFCAIRGMDAFLRNLYGAPGHFNYNDLLLALFIFWVVGPIILFNETLGKRSLM